MTRKDFELIAEVIRLFPWISDAQRDVGDLIAVRLANALATTNPRFDTERFLKACGIEE